MAKAASRTIKNVSQQKVSGNYRWRFVLLMIGLLLGALALSAKAVFLHVVKRDYLLEQGDNRYTRVMSINANRGNITDRYGKILAASAPVVSVWCDPKELLAILKKNKEEQAELKKNLEQTPPVLMSQKERQRIESLPVNLWALADILQMDKSTLEQRIISHSNSRFVYLSRQMPPEMEQMITDLKFPAVYVQNEYRRYYPATEITAPLVGFTNIDDHGQEGVEYMFEKELASQDGKRRVIKDLRGAVIEDLSLIEPARPGDDLQLSIDLRMQYIVYQALGKALKEQRANKGMAAILNVKTGEVLAMVSLPAFNPNDRSRGNASLRRNRVAIDIFEPGSTIKPFVMATALEQGVINTKDVVDTSPGYVVVGDKTIRDHRDYGKMTPEYIIAKSSNVGMVKVMERIDDEALFDTLNALGFGLHLSTGFPGEQAGDLPQPPYSKLQKSVMSYGYGLSVTCLQLAHAYSILASGGISYPVSLVKEDQPVKGQRIFSEKTAKTVLKMMEAVVTDGTAKRAGIDRYIVAGKTGTAYKSVKGQYASNQYVSSFVGVAPANNPQYVMAVVLDNPKNGEHFGGSIAAPVFAQVMESLLPLSGVQPDKTITEKNGLNDISSSLTKRSNESQQGVRDDV